MAPWLAVPPQLTGTLEWALVGQAEVGHRRQGRPTGTGWTAGGHRTGRSTAAWRATWSGSGRRSWEGCREPEVRTEERWFSEFRWNGFRSRNPGKCRRFWLKMMYLTFKLGFTRGYALIVGKYMSTKLLFHPIGWKLRSFKRRGAILKNLIKNCKGPM